MESVIEIKLSIVLFNVMYIVKLGWLDWLGWLGGK